MGARSTLTGISDDTYDRFDYFVRDSHMIGEPIKINLTRYVEECFALPYC